MKASELRIGNWVDLVGSNSSFQIDTIYDNELSGIEPIPLTEEWLERLGFEGYSMDIDKDGYYHIDVSFLGGVNVYINDVELSHINHVHQLQNIYHALTGNELKHEEHSIST